MDYIMLGKNISAVRRSKRLTQEQLAELTDVSTVFISQIETAARKPSLETVYRIARALETTIDSLIDAHDSSAMTKEITNVLNERNETELIFLHSIIREICDYMEQHGGKM